MDSDLRYERPCKLLLAAGAIINWVVAVLLWTNYEDVEYVSSYASDVATWLGMLLG